MALKLVKHLYHIVGVDLSTVIRLEALICEYQKNFSKAKKLLRKATEEAYNSETMYFLKGELRRVEGKERDGSEYNVEVVS